MNAKGQFVSANTAENAVAGLTVVPRGHVGNDILDFNGDTYAVSVWGDASTSPGIAWEVNYSASSYSSCTTFAQTTFIFNPDVCLVEDGTDVYAIVVYWKGSTSNTYYWEPYIWANSGGWGFQRISSGTFNSASFGTSLHIDGNDNGEFVIVWDDTSPEVYVETGDVLSGPALSTNIVGVSNGGNGYSPDACIFHDGGNNIVHIAYIDNNGDLNVDDHAFSTLASGSASSLSTQLNTSPLINAFYFPRIACPNSTGGGGDWLVVVEDNDGSSDFSITGYTSGTTNTYNDGSAAPYTALNSFANYRPVVTYSDQGTTAWVGWIFDNYSTGSIGGTVDAFYPIAIECDGQGNVFGTDYWVVPYTLGTADELDFLSISGRYASDKLYLTYNNVLTSEIWTKFIDPISSATSFRNGNINPSSYTAFEDIYNTLEKDKNNLDYDFKLIDLTGRQILIESGNAMKIKNLLKELPTIIREGIYLMQLISDDGKVSFNQKISVM